jgi:excinuclease ABC subunit A
MDYIKVRGARQHNLKGVDLDIPKNKFVVFTGVSGSGKSSLAFDTIYAEGQRRYVESLSSYARQFLGIMAKPDCDLIEGLSPAISIDQKTTTHNPRSTVGTTTEIYDYLRLLFARIGHPHCPVCGEEISTQSAEQITNALFELITRIAGKTKIARFLILSPIVKDKKGEFASLMDNLKAKGFTQARIDGQIRDLEEDLYLIKTNKHTIEAVSDKIAVSQKDLKDPIFSKNLKSRIADSVEQALNLTEGLVVIAQVKDAGFEFPKYPKMLVDHLFSERFACPKDNISFPEIEPRTFSFNSPHGACPQCTGIGKILEVEPNLIFAPELTINEGGILPFATSFEYGNWQARKILALCDQEGIDPREQIKNLSENQKKILLDYVRRQLDRRYQTTDSDYTRTAIERFMRETICPACQGLRLKKESLSITIDNKNISQVTALDIGKISTWVQNLEENPLLSIKEKEIGKLILKEIRTRLNFLESVGLNYLTLDRTTGSLSGGEAQRIRLASQIGTGLSGVLYVLDEPSIGLHQKDNQKLINTLKKLRDLGNTVVVVEHDLETMQSADYLVDFGPGAGKDGGVVVAQGTPAQVAANTHSLTGKYLSGKRKIEIRKGQPGNGSKNLKIFGASQFNLKNINVNFPLGKLIVVTGVSGSGKSTLVVETLFHALFREINPFHKTEPGIYKRLEGVENIQRLILVDQSPIGRTPRSNPATYTKTFDLIRKAFAQTKTARALGFKPGRFSFNVKGGRCEACEGQGQIKIEMQFMSDIWVDCEVCHGARYNHQTLEVELKAKNIADVLKMTVSEAQEFFHNYAPIVAKLETLLDVGLGYIELGQPAPTLSGGEAQRVKLATELTKKGWGKTLYILDEPTTGLHFADLEKLLQVLRILVDRGNTVIVIEHNLDVVKNADWVIDLGPDGGEKGGELVAEGTPHDLTKNKASYTGRFLRAKLES